MWVLLVVNLVTSAMLSVPGYTTEAACNAGGKEMIASFEKIRKGARVAWICTKPS
jgi:hypothetical protein